jgi:hypothetical protein
VPLSSNDERRLEIVERLARSIEARGLQAPAIAFLEANKPFSFLGSQLLLLSQPLFDILGRGELASAWAEALEDRDTVEMIIRRLETGPANP